MSKRKPYELSEAPQSESAPTAWPSLAALRDPDAHQKLAETEFPGLREALAEEQVADVPLVSLTRRNFFTLAGATAAAAALEGCIRRPEENILPFSRAPEYVVPGVPLHYATVMDSRGEALGLLVESHEGRPTKIEGNPNHPSSLGATNLWAQASILSLYDPDRARSPQHKVDARRREDMTFVEFDAWFRRVLAEHESDGGARLRVLAQPSNSPTFIGVREQFVRRFPSAKIHTWSSAAGGAREGARIAFGQPIVAQYDYQNARVILALDSDFLMTEPGNVRATRAFAAGRRLETPQATMSRLYVVEPCLTVTGGNADHRLRLPARDIEWYLRAVARELATSHGIQLADVGAVVSGARAPAGVPETWIREVARDLAENRQRGIITVGSRQPARVHALAHAINAALGNSGSTVSFLPCADPSEAEQVADLKALVDDIGAGHVSLLVMLGGNPVYDAPADFGFADKLSRVETSIHLSDRANETSERATWLVPHAHELESWGDQIALDGTRAVQQPLIAPLFGGRSDIELLGLMANIRNWRGYYLVRATMRAAAPAASATFERDWRRVLHRGVVDNSAYQPLGALPVASPEVARLLRDASQPSALGRDNLEVAFALDPKLLDGRFSNNTWLLEMPDPITRISWDNAALVSPRTARDLNLTDGDLVRLSGGHGGAKPIELAVYVLSGVADWSITLSLGWGRTRAGRYGNGHGFNVGPLRVSTALAFMDGIRVSKLGRKYAISQTQEQHAMEGRPIAIDTTISHYRQSPEFAARRSPDPETQPLWTRVDYTDPTKHRWGMSIDLNTCVGCSACVVACQSENNVPSVGKDMVRRGREMHWLRVDRYFVNPPWRRREDDEPDENDPAVAYQPLMCVQCEEAPCENVCPVNATTHSPEGLNDMAYNRCIGTRYCMNNCPYKVRRFNYLSWHGYLDNKRANYDEIPETRKMQFNPNVTVRFRGVMEKCNYCVQRIQEAKIDARRDGRTLADGDIVTACAQACPATAIVFGDLNDPQSRVAQLSRVDRGYKLLAEIGTHPRTTYLGKVRNPNPNMTHSAAAPEEHTGL